MAVNSSVSSSDYLSWLQCSFTSPDVPLFTSFTITNILLFLPLYVLILHRGLQRWRSSSKLTATSPSDSFTYHLVVMEILNVCGCIFFCCGVYWTNFSLIKTWYFLYCCDWYGKTFFHLLTCVEHFMAVVHPITYLSIRKQRGIRIRNILIGFIWLFSFGFTILIMFEVNSYFSDVWLLIMSIIIMSFCCLSVLCVLIRPGPGEQGRVRVDQSKLRAFYTILVILGVLTLRLVSNLLWLLQTLLTDTDSCTWITFEMWVNIPSSLVLPLLFLHRAGLLAVCHNGNK